MKRNLWLSVVLAFLGAPAIGEGVYQIWTGYAFAKGHHVPIARSEHPYEYWITIGFWFALGLVFVVHAVKIYLGDDEDSGDGQDK